MSFDWWHSKRALSKSHEVCLHTQDQWPKRPKSELFEKRKRKKMNFLSLILFVGLAGRTLSVSSEKPAIYDLSFGNKLVESKKFFLVCLLSNSDPNATFEWFLNGQKIAPNENVHVNQLDDSSMLNIRQMSLELSGEYECRVANRFGRDSRRISVRLEGESATQKAVSKELIEFLQSSPSFWSSRRTSRRN